MDEEGLKRPDLEKMLKNLVDHQETIEASMKPLSQLMFSKLSAMVEAGFTREEAMDMLKARGLNA
jgi:hypothetical protein